LAAYFFDSSALARLYHPEVGTPEVGKIVRTRGIQVRISRLTVVELPSVFATKVRTQFISREDARLLVRQFQEDIVAQKFLVTAIREPEFAVAKGRRYCRNRPWVGPSPGTPAICCVQEVESCVADEGGVENQPNM
jgi:hypothetical protein